MRQVVLSGPSRNPATPARVSCASEICPVNPVTTTYDRPMTAKISVVTNAARVGPDSTRISSAAPAVATTLVRSSARGRGAAARSWRRITPRLGSGRLRTSRTTRISTSGTSSASPDPGSHVFCDLRKSISDWSMPIAKPPITTGPTRSKAPSSAVASAGTMKRVYWIGTNGTIGAIRMPAMPHTTALSIQLAAAIRSGDRPLISAPRSLSDAARVASPNRVKRVSAQTATATATTDAANQTRSLPTVTPASSYWSTGKMRCTGGGVVPRRMTMTPVMTTITPRDATALAVAEAARSGRNTARYRTRPSAAEAPNEMRTLGASCSGAPMSIDSGRPGTSRTSSPRRRPA